MKKVIDAEVDDPAVAACDDRRVARPRAEEVALEVRRQDVVPLLLGDLGPRPARVDRRVVDQDVDPPELAGDRVAIASIDGLSETSATTASAAPPAASTVGSSSIAPRVSDDGHRGAGGGEREADAFAQAAAAAGDDRDPPVEPEGARSTRVKPAGIVSASGTARPSARRAVGGLDERHRAEVVRPEISGSASSWIARISWPIVPLNACGNQRSSHAGAPTRPSIARVVQSIVEGLPAG